MLSWGALIASLLRFLGLSARIVFHKKLLFMGAGISIYYAILYAVAVFRPGEGFSVEQALHVLVEAPELSPRSVSDLFFAPEAPPRSSRTWSLREL